MLTFPRTRGAEWSSRCHCNIFVDDENRGSFRRSQKNLYGQDIM